MDEGPPRTDDAMSPATPPQPDRISTATAQACLPCPPVSMISISHEHCWLLHSSSGTDVSKGGATGRRTTAVGVVRPDQLEVQPPRWQADSAVFGGCCPGVGTQQCGTALFVCGGGGGGPLPPLTRFG